MRNAPQSAPESNVPAQNVEPTGFDKELADLAAENRGEKLSQLQKHEAKVRQEDKKTAEGLLAEITDKKGSAEGKSFVSFMAPAKELPTALADLEAGMADQFGPQGGNPAAIAAMYA